MPKEPAYKREHLEKIIENGGSVMHRGELITHKDNLPSNADIKAAHEGKERVEYRRLGDAPSGSAPTGDPPNPDEEGKPPEGTDSAAIEAAKGQPASNATIRETKPA